jgi:hypothetical protein
MAENKVKKVTVNTTINGQEMDILIDPYVSLLETLREVVGITGTKEGCNFVFDPSLHPSLVPVIPTTSRNVSKRLTYGSISISIS